MVGRRHLKQDIHSEFFERNVTKMLDHNTKEIARLKEENEFLAEASAFFAASRRKSAKNQECSLLIGRPKAARSKGKLRSIVVCSMYPDKDFTGI